VNPAIEPDKPDAVGDHSRLISLFNDRRYRRIASAVMSGGAARVLSSSLTLISLPLAVRYLGAERYGVWATVVSVAVWVNLLDLGIAYSLTNVISQAYARHDRATATRGFANALAVTLGAAALTGCVFFLVWQRVNWVAVFNASPALRSEVRATVLVAAALMLAGLPLNLAGKVFAGYQELHTYNQTVALGSLCSLVGLAVGIWLRAPMPILFLLSYGCVTAVSGATLLWLVLWHKPWLRPRLQFIDRDTTIALLGTGWSFLLIHAAAIVVFSTDNIIVSHYLGAAQVTPYSITWRVVGLGAVLQALVFPALWPAYAEAQARGDVAWIRRTFSMVMRVTIALNLAWAAVIVVFGRMAIRLWAGSAAVPPSSLLIAMAVWSVIAGFATAQSCLLGALNRTRVQAIASSIAAMANLALSVFLVTRMGSLGVILGTIISYIVVLLIPQSIVVLQAVRDLTRTDLAPAQDKPTEIQPIA